MLENCKSLNITRNKIAAIVTDNGQNIVGASKEAFGPQKHIPCFAHTLNLVVTRSIDFHYIKPGAELYVDIVSDNDDIQDELE